MSKQKRLGRRRLERMLATTYYGKETWGMVVVLNGGVVFHGTDAETAKYLKRMKSHKSKCPQMERV